MREESEIFEECVTEELKIEIAYICDKKKKCAGTRGCGGEFCNHTLDPNHALNGICEDPEHDSRFRDRGNGYFEEILQQEEL